MEQWEKIEKVVVAMVEMDWKLMSLEVVIAWVCRACTSHDDRRPRPCRTDPFLVVLTTSWNAPGGSTLEHHDPGPGPFAPVVTSAPGPELGLRRAAGLMRLVRSMTLVKDEEATRTPLLCLR